MMTLLVFLAATQDTAIEDTEYAADFAKVVRAYEAAAQLSKTNPAAALRALEEEVLSRLPRTFEATLVVKFSKGITKGEEKERHAFFPYRLAGDCTLAVNDPARAVKYYEKSPTSMAQLEMAKKALAEKEKKAVEPARPPLQRPEFTVAPLLDRHDFTGALEAVRKERENLGKNYDTRVREVRDAALRHQRSATATLAAALPRLKEPGFRKDHLEPCLESCSKVPTDYETDELRWVRKLGEWLAKPEPPGLEPLALEAARFDPDYHVVCEQAQRARLAEIEKLVDEARRTGRAERQGVLERLETSERAFRKLSAARAYRDLDDTLQAALARRPIDNQKLEEARKGVSTVSEIRVLASQLELLWTSADRAKLADQDQKDLAVYLGVYRCYALFLEGKSVEETAQDLRVVEVFRNAPGLPKGLSPKVASVLDLVKSAK